MMMKISFRRTIKKIESQASNPNPGEQELSLSVKLICSVKRHFHQQKGLRGPVCIIKELIEAHGVT